MGDTRRRSLWSAVIAVVVGALVVTPAASALGERTPTAARTGGVAAALDPGKPGHEHPAELFQNSVVQETHEAAEADGPVTGAASLPSGFADVEVITGVSEAVSVAFAPSGTAFVALKTGLVKSFDYDASSGTFESNATATDFADLRTPVNNYWDRGLTGITVDPAFPTRPYVYVSYTYNKDPRGGSVPAWGDPAEAYDQCEAPATTSPARAGCPVMMRVSRVTAQSTAAGWVMVPGSEKPLLTGGCFQFGSHASGDVVFGPDGKLYASAGEGASFDTLDYGQYANPCPGDLADEGGSLRSQDYRTSSDALDFDGSIVRIDPDNTTTPTPATAGDWLVAYGQRNPWRLAFRPGTDQLWSGDVGGSAWEEINRLDGAPASRTPVNRGWPCYEGAWTGIQKHPGWDALDKPICETLYADVAAGRTSVAAPYFSYETRGPKLTPNEDCQNSTSSVSGVAFTTAASNYPAQYKDALYFSDFARSCVWRLGKKSNGDPDPATIVPFVQDAQTPVNLKVGPGGDLYYVDYGLRPDGSVEPGAAGVHRIVYSGTSNSAPTARITADKLSGAAPLTVTFNGTTSTDPEGGPLTYAWDLDGDGAYDDSTSATPARTFPTGTHTVGLQVTDNGGLTATASVQVQAGNTAPVLGTITPAASLTWAVGDRIAFSGTATDAQDGTLPASAFTWEVTIQHCPSGVCHSHPLTAFPGVSSGSFLAPDHEYPSNLLLTVTATDSGGLTATRSIRLDPKTVALTWASSPTGAGVTVNGATHTTPYTETFIQGSRLTMTAAASNGSASFTSWSDGGARSHEISAPATATTYTATYTANSAPVARATANPSSGPAPLSTTLSAATSTDPDGDPLTYAWDTDGDGAFDDGTTASVSPTYNRVGATTAQVRVSDNRGGTATASVVVTVTNRLPTAVISANPTSGNAPLAVSLSGAGSSDPDGTALSYGWEWDGDDDFNDATTVTANPTFSTPGTRTVKLRVRDADGGTATAQVTVSVNGVPTAQASATPASGPGPLTTTLSAAGSSDPDGDTLSYAWDTDDDGQYDDGTTRDVTATYSGVGAKTARVRVSDGKGGTATKAVTVTVTNRLPVAAISANPTSGPAPLTVSLSGAGSSDPEGTQLTYAWEWDGDDDFDDATTVTANPTFATPGTRTVKLRVTDANGGQATATTSINVANNAPVAAARATPSSGNAPLQTTLSAQGSTDRDGDALSYRWDTDDDGQFDDGTTRDVAATYTGVGTKTARVEVSDGRGATDVATVAITVTNRAPAARVAATPTGGEAPLPVSLTAAGSSDPDGTALTYAWEWDGDDDFAEATGLTASHTFTAAGTYPVKVRVTDADGGTAVAQTTVTVTAPPAPPVATVTATPPTGSAPLTVAFDGTASTGTGTLSYAWDLDGDGQYDDSAVAQPSATYPVGTVTVGLEVTDGRGVTARATTQVTATNTAPFLTRVTTYPAGGFSTGQRLGFDAAASDLQEQVPDSAYSFVMYRQDCVSGCPRTPVQRWDGVQNGQFTVPQLPFPSRLVLVATVRDSQGLTATRELVVEPQAATLRVKGTRKVPVTLDGETGRTVTKTVVAGSTVTVSAKKVVTRKGVRYRFVRWSDGGARTHTVTAWAASTTITAKYRRLG